MLILLLNLKLQKLRKSEEALNLDGRQENQHFLLITTHGSTEHGSSVKTLPRRPRIGHQATHGTKGGN